MKEFSTYYFAKADEKSPKYYNDIGYFEPKSICVTLKQKSTIISVHKKDLNHSERCVKGARV